MKNSGNIIYGSDNFKEKINKYEVAITEEHRELKIETHHHCVVVPYRNYLHSPSPSSLNEGGIFDRNGNLIDLAKTKVSKMTVHVGAPETYDVKQKFKYIDDDVIFLGNFSTHFGHFLVDSLSRLWIYLNNDFFKKKAVYTGESDVFFIELLEIFGLDKKNIMRIKSPTRFRSVIIPEQSNLLYEKSYHKKYKKIFDKISIASNEYSYDKIYLSRRKFQKDKTSIMGESEIEEMFRSNGFKIVYPEKISIKKQIGLLKNCKHLAGIQGSALHLSLFARDCIKLTTIHREHGSIFPEQIKINKMKNINNTSIEADLDFLRPFPFDVAYAVSIRNEYMKQCLQESSYKYTDTIVNPKSLEEYISAEEYRKWKKSSKVKRKIKEKLIIFITNFIFIKSLRKRIRYSLINR